MANLLQLVACIACNQALLHVLREQDERGKHFSSTENTVQPFVMLYDQDSEELYLPSTVRNFVQVDGTEFQDELRLPLFGDRSIVCRVARESLEAGSIIVKAFGDVTQDVDNLPINRLTHSLLCAGLTETKSDTGEKQLWGVLAVSSPAFDAFDERDEMLMTLAARQGLLAVERARRADQIASGKSAEAAMAWHSEIVHTFQKAPLVISPALLWFRRIRPDLSAVMETVEQLQALPDDSAERLGALVPGTVKHRSELYKMAERLVEDGQKVEDLLRKLHKELSDMLNAEVPTIEKAPFSELMRDIDLWKNENPRFDGVQLQWAEQEEDLALFCDRRLAIRCLQNLINNASEAMGGHGDIQVTTRCHW